MKPLNALYQKINQVLMELLSNVPSASAKLSPPESLIKSAAYKSAALSGTLSLPAGPLAALTLIPDVVGVWKIQAQLVADIAAYHGKSQQLTRESMLYCLFGGGGTALEDLVVRAGERFIVRRSSQKIFENLLGKISLKIARSLLGDRIARLLPFIGAAVVARYSFKDTAKVGTTAHDFFRSDIEIQ